MYLYNQIDNTMNLFNNVSTVILANGKFPSKSFPLSLIEKANYLVCTDGAANEFISKGGIPDAIVGDCDSISVENKKRFAEILHPNHDQETNDLTKSVEFCVNNGKRDIIIVGGTGKREDHTLGNISLLAEYIYVANVVMVTDWGIFTSIREDAEFESFKGEQVSLFSIDQKDITTHNLQYPLTNNILTNWWQGSLNRSMGSSFKIETKGRIIVYQAFGDN